MAQGSRRGRHVRGRRQGTLSVWRGGHGTVIFNLIPNFMNFYLCFFVFSFFSFMISKSIALLYVQY